MPDNTRILVPSAQNPLYHAPLVAVLSFLCGTVLGVFYPLAGIVLPPCIGPAALAVIAVRVKASTEEKAAWLAWVATATVVIPLGALSYLML